MIEMICLNFQRGFTIAYMKNFINISLSDKTLTTIVISSASSYKGNSFKEYHALKRSPIQVVMRHKLTHIIVYTSIYHFHI